MVPQFMNDVHVQREGERRAIFSLSLCTANRYPSPIRCYGAIEGKKSSQGGLVNIPCLGWIKREKEQN